LDKRPKLKEIDVRFGMWNVRSLYRACSHRTVVKEISKYKLDLVEVQEATWDRGDTESRGKKYAFSYGKRNENCKLGTGFSYIREPCQ
jgi:hypothetical protein